MRVKPNEIAWSVTESLETCHCVSIERMGKDLIDQWTPVLACLLVASCAAEVAGPESGRAPIQVAPGAHVGIAGANAAAPSGSPAVAVNASMNAAGAPAANSPSASMALNLAGAPQYTRFVRLTNAQWARSVQDILRLPEPSGLETFFQVPVAGT